MLEFIELLRLGRSGAGDHQRASVQHVDGNDLYNPAQLDLPKPSVAVARGCGS